MLPSRAYSGFHRRTEKSLQALILTKFVSWATGVFYDVERSGPPMADGPLLVTTNHPNALVDPLVVFNTGGRPSRPMARAPLFDQAFSGTLLRGLRGLPVYRREDDPALMHQNDRTFDAAIEALHAGEAVQIFPEGHSHSLPALAEIRTGAARIAMMAEARAGWKLGLRIQPIGLTYSRKHLFRGRVLATYGQPFSVAEYRERFERDERATVREVTARIRSGIEALTLNFQDQEDSELVDVAERLYARHKGMARWRERDRMAERLPRLQRFAAGFEWLKGADPDRFERLRASVRRYLRLLTLLGASEGDVPPRYGLAPVMLYVLLQLVMMVLVLPAAVVGMIAWAPPWVLTRWVAPRFRPKLDQVATYKLSVALLAFPLWYGIVATWAMWRTGPGLTVIAVLIGMPVVGMAAVAWRDRQREVLEDTRVFLRAVRHRRGRDRLAEERSDLVREIDELAEAWSISRATPIKTSGPTPEA